MLSFHFVCQKAPLLSHGSILQMPNEQLNEPMPTLDSVDASSSSLDDCLNHSWLDWGSYFDSQISRTSAVCFEHIVARMVLVVSNAYFSFWDCGQRSLANCDSRNHYFAYVSVFATAYRQQCYHPRPYYLVTCHELPADSSECHQCFLVFSSNPMVAAKSSWPDSTCFVRRRGLANESQYYIIFARTKITVSTSVHEYYSTISDCASFVSCKQNLLDLLYFHLVGHDSANQLHQLIYTICKCLEVLSSAISFFDCPPYLFGLYQNLETSAYSSTSISSFKICFIHWPLPVGSLDC